MCEPVTTISSPVGCAGAPCARAPTSIQPASATAPVSHSVRSLSRILMRPVCRGGTPSARDLPLVYDDLALLHDDLRLEPVPVALERIAGEQHDVGELAGLERAELVLHLNIRRRIRAH